MKNAVCHTTEPRKRIFKDGIAFTFAAVFFLFSIFSAVCLGQDDPGDAAAPPLSLMSKLEKSSIESENDPKNRTKRVLELMDARIIRAEKLYSSSDFDGMFSELGGFQALMDYSLTSLSKGGNTDKNLGFFKKIEIGLRGFATRLEMIRRELPERYDKYVGILLKYVRDARTKAIEPLFGNTVVPSIPSKPPDQF